MKKELILSNQSRELIRRYEDLLGITPLNTDSFITINKLLDWLVTNPLSVLVTNDKLNEAQYLAATLSNQLLNEVYLVLHKAPDTIENLSINKNYHLRFYLIAAAGAFVAACDGFDAINTLLSSFIVFPSFILCVASTFSLLSVMFFCCLNVERIAEGLRFVLWAPKLLDLYFVQLTYIKAIHKEISLINLADLTVAELDSVQQLMRLVHKKYHLLVNDSKPFLNITTNESLSLSKKIMLTIAGIFFFSTGFSTGQSVISALMGLFFAQASVVMPVLIFGLSVALAAFSFFWWMDKHDLNKSVSSLFGFNEEKIMQLCDQEMIDEQERELMQLDGQISSTLRLKVQNTQKSQWRQNEHPVRELFPTATRLFFRRLPDKNVLDEESYTNRPRTATL